MTCQQQVRGPEDIQLCLVTVISIMISHVNFSINCQAGDHHNILLSLLHSNLFSRESELLVFGVRHYVSDLAKPNM